MERVPGVGFLARQGGTKDSADGGFAQHLPSCPDDRIWLSLYQRRTVMPSAVYSLIGKRVWVAGHKGLVGSALVRRLQSENCEIVTANRNELDLTRQQPVEDWVRSCRPDMIFLAAGRVGG